MASPRVSSACASTYGAAPITSLILARLLGGQLPVGHAPAGVKDLDVREHRQHAVAHLLLKAVHHRKHDDQGRDAERDAEHRHSEMKEMKPFCACARRPACSASQSAIRRASSWGNLRAARCGRRLESGPAARASGMLPDGPRPTSLGREGDSDNRAMHPLVPSASDTSEACQHVLRDLSLPRLESPARAARAWPAADEGDAPLPSRRRTSARPPPPGAGTAPTDACRSRLRRRGRRHRCPRRPGRCSRRHTGSSAATT